MEVINGDKAARDAAAKKVVNSVVGALGYGAKGDKINLKKAIKDFNIAEKTFQHTQGKINDYKKIDPEHFAIANNLT